MLLEKYTLPELREKARSRGIRYSGLRKGELIDRLRGGRKLKGSRTGCSPARSGSKRRSARKTKRRGSPNGRKRCPHGVKKDGTCKKKPGPKKGSKRRSSRSKRRSARRSKHRCPYGVKKDGTCKKKPGPKKGSKRRSSRSSPKRRSTRRSPKRSSPKRRSTRRSPKRNSPSSGPERGKLAFCFLLYDKVQHRKIWEDFLAQDPAGLQHSVYSHVKKVTKDTPSWIKKAKVRTVKTNWCGEGLLYAYANMLKKALKDPENSFFPLVSGTCIPIRSFQRAYKMCTSDPRAKMYWHRPRKGLVFRDWADIYSGHQWCVLNREVATEFVRMLNPKDKKGSAFLKEIRGIYLQNGARVGKFTPTMEEGHTWTGGCPDEVYPFNWLVALYGAKNLSKHVKKQMTTFTAWDFKKDPDHPETFNKKTVVGSIKKILGPGHIFARKFTAEAARYVVERGW